MHYRNLTAIVCRELMSHYLGKPLKNVNAGDLLSYSQSIQSSNTQRGCLTETVKCIFQILFTKVNDLVVGWIRQGTPLVNVLFNGEEKCTN